MWSLRVEETVLIQSFNFDLILQYIDENEEDLRNYGYKMEVYLDNKAMGSVQLSMEY
jgi:hypothetical protein